MSLSKLLPLFCFVLAVCSQCLSIYFAYSFNNEEEIYSSVSDAVCLLMFAGVALGVYELLYKYIVIEGESEVEYAKAKTAELVLKSKELGK